ncbi:MAG: prepilin-type N-terminal cleavage/methylation domain-containing protein [Planctomycetota bacterium]
MHKITYDGSQRSDIHKYRIPAFTLIEVLVVVAIIALLAAILIPSLQRAREQAKIASCKANCKQIANIIATYQSEFKGYVPVLFNYGAEERGFHDHPEHLAMNSYLPVAFRAYDKGTKKLARMTVAPNVPLKGETEFFNPQEAWYKDKRLDFELRIMPSHYACPFGREKGNSEFTFVGTKSTKLGKFDVSVLDGQVNAYVTWMWEGRIIKNIVPLNEHGKAEPYPGDNPSINVNGPTDGRPKYSVLSWSYIRWTKQSYPYGPPPGFIETSSDDKRKLNNKILRMHRKWKIADAQRQKASSFSQTTIVYCHLGKHTATPAESDYGHAGNIQIRNPDSHRSNMGGGTNVIFADSHVEWVKGTQVGWD